MVSDTAQKKSTESVAGPPVRRRVCLYTRGFGLVFAALLVFAGLAYVSALEHLRRRAAADLNRQARLAAAVLDATAPDGRRARLEGMADACGHRVLLVGGNGEVRLDSLRPGGDGPARPLPQPAAALRGEAVLARTQERVLVLPPAGSFEEANASLRRRFLWVTAAGLGLLGVVLARMASSWTRVLGQMEEAARRLGRGDIRHHMPLPDDPLFHPLAESLNEMSDQLFLQIQTVVRQRNQLQTLLESMSDGLLACDDEEVILDLNRPAAAWLGAEADAARGRRVYDFCRNPELRQIIRQVVETGAAQERDLTLEAGGHERLLRARGTMLNRLEGRRGVLLILQDVTHLRRLENMRRDFAANVSHELRTPVTSIRGYAETLLDGALDDRADAARMVEIIQRQAERLMAIFDDLLKLSRIEQQGEQDAIVLAPADLGPLLSAAVEPCARQAAALGIRVELEQEPDLRANVHPVLLEQAVSNLLDNAIKYGGSGRWVGVTARRSPDGGITIAVSDRGPGIEPRHFERLFERFYRVDRARSRSIGGTGLGLAIVKHIAQAHGGDVAVESAPGRGATFLLRLPPLPASEVPPAHPDEASPSPIPPGAPDS